MLIHHYWHALYPAEPAVLIEMLRQTRIIDAAIAVNIHYKDCSGSMRLREFGSVCYNPLGLNWLEYTNHDNLPVGIIASCLPIPHDYQAIAMEHDYLSAAIDHLYPFTEPSAAEGRVMLYVDGELPPATHVLLGHMWVQYKAQTVPELSLGFGTYLDQQGRCRDERIMLNDYQQTDQQPHELVVLLFPMLSALAMLAQQLGHLRLINTDGPIAVWRLVPGINTRML